MKAPPTISRISAPVVRAFACLVNRPGQWFTAAELSGAGKTSESTVYHRFANLASAGAVRVRQRAGFREFSLHPRWDDSALALQLHTRALAAGQIGQTPP
ncbi:MAG: hypothetical protein ABL916_24290 [Burkholderiaceae bacterium]